MGHKIKKSAGRTSPKALPTAAVFSLLEAGRPDDVFPRVLEAARALGFPRGLVLEIDCQTRRIAPVAELHWPGAGLNRFRAALVEHSLVEHSKDGHPADQILKDGAPAIELSAIFHTAQPFVLARSSLHNKPVYIHPVAFGGSHLCGENPPEHCLAGTDSRKSDEAQSGPHNEQPPACPVCGVPVWRAVVIVEQPSRRNQRAIRELARLIEAAALQRSRLECLAWMRMRTMLTPVRLPLPVAAASIPEAGLSAADKRNVEIERFAATGWLAATIAHEVNNPMEAIKNAIYLLSGSVPENAMPVYNILKSETERVARIVRQMLGLYRNAEQVKPVNVNTIVEETLRLQYRHLQRMGIEVRAELAPLPDAIIAADQIRQVISNLVLNARDAMPSGGRLRIRSRHLPARGERHGWVRVLIADSGEGISRELKPAIFDPFVTTKGEKGTGLGLWIARGIVQSHHGRLSVKSKIGVGTVFRLDLPVGEK